jgi:broad specificity phosphatase PhoE
MTQIVLIRPGTTPFDEQGRIQGTLDIPLSQRGSAEVRKLADELAVFQIDAVYSCPCQSACETANAVAEALGAKYKPLDRLQNVNQGLWQGRCMDEVRQTQPKVYRQWQERPETVCPPGGETLCEAWERVEATIAKLLRKHDDETIAMVVPEPMASLVRSHLVGGELSDLWKAHAAGGQWEVITIGERDLVRA